MDAKTRRLAVICPIYSDGQTIAYFFDRIKKALQQLDPLESTYQRICEHRF